MNLKRSICFLLLGAGLLTTACGDRDAPEDLIQEEVYIKAFLDMVLINQMSEDQLGDSTRDELRERALQRHGITQDQFNRSHQYYQRQPDKQTERLDKMEEILTEERDLFRERLDEQRQQNHGQSAIPDTLNL